MTTKDNNKKDKLSNFQNNLVPTPTQQEPVLTLDVEYYQSKLDDTEITEDQKREFIETLWSIVVQFVDLGFGIHPLQQAMQDETKSIDILDYHPEIKFKSGKLATISHINAPAEKGGI